MGLKRKRIKIWMGGPNRRASGSWWVMRALFIWLAFGAAVLLALLSFSGFSMAAGPDGGGSSITVSEKSSASRPVLNLSGSSFGGFTKITVLWNPATGTATRESYLYGDSLRRESTMGVDGDGTEMAVSAEFDGMARLGVVKLSSPNATPQGTPAFEASESYYGSFKIDEKVDDCGSSIASERSVSGTGYVAVNKKVGDLQRTHEAGTGSYESEERIDTYTSYIAKSVSLSAEPEPFGAAGISANLSLPWREGVASRKEGESYIGEEYSGLTRLDKTTIVRGLGEMETEANFSGTARYRMISSEELEMDESYRGDYAISRNVELLQPSVRDPHLSVEKDGTIVYEGDRTLARYVITLENDGGKTLEPVLVRDIFPPGGVFVRSSLKHTLTSDGANWSLTHLSPGDLREIELVLDVTEYGGEELVNRVVAFGGIDGSWVSAANFSAVEINWLSCSSPGAVFISKAGEVDEAVGNHVLYSLEVENLGDRPLVATVTDRLPDGMRLISSSPAFASYEDGVITWNLIDLAPGKVETVVYGAEALWSGRFVNIAEVAARYVDGSSIEPARARSVVEVDEFEGERPRPGWQPPAWGLGEAEEIWG